MAKAHDEANLADFRVLVSRVQEQYTALIAAYEVMKMVPAADARVPEGADTYHGLVNAASRWVTRFGVLAKPPMEVTVEDDDDPEGAGTESEYQVTERDDGRCSNPHCSCGY